MDQETIVRAWEDPQFRAGLTPELLASLPTHPSGPSMHDLDDVEVRRASGGGGGEGGGLLSLLICTGIACGNSFICQSVICIGQDS